MNKTALKKILDHPDKDEIIAKLILGISPKDVTDWLSGKYTNVSEAKFVIAEKSIKSFQDNYLDIYTTIKDDFAKTKNAMVNGTESSLELSIQENSAYKSLVIETVGKELDIKQKLNNMCSVVETRFSQIFDSLQEDPRNMNTRVDRVLVEYVNAFSSLLEKAYKIINNGPDQVIQHNITVQHIDQHIAVFYEVIKKVLAQMDLESSMYFMELFNEEINKIQDPANRVIQPVDERLAEVKVLNETMNKKINEQL